MNSSLATTNIMDLLELIGEAATNTKRENRIWKTII